MFLYFDAEQMVNNLSRWLKPGGVLVISHFSWLPVVGSVAAASEKLILQHTPAGRRKLHGAYPTTLSGAISPDALLRLLYYDEGIPLRGRLDGTHSLPQASARH